MHTRTSVFPTQPDVSPASSFSMPTTPAGGKENIGGVDPDAGNITKAQKPARRGVGPRSGTKNASPRVSITGSPAGLVAAKNSSAVSPAPSKTRPATARPSSSTSTSSKNTATAATGARALAAKASSSGRGVAVAASARQSSAAGKPQAQQKRKRSRPAVLVSSPAPPRVESDVGGSSGGSGGGGGKKRKSAVVGGEGGGKKQQQQRGSMGKKRLKPNKERNRQTKVISHPAARSSAPPLRLPSRGRSDFDFDSDDSAADDDNRARNAVPAAAAPASRKKTRGEGAAGNKVKRMRTSSGGRREEADGSRARPLEGLAAASPAPGTRGAGTESTTTAACPSSLPKQTAHHSSTSTARSGGGSSEASASSSPRGPWRLGALFADSDDDESEGDGEGGGGLAGCNWRLSDDENEGDDEIDLHKRKSPRRSAAGRGGRVSAMKKMRRASGGGRGRGSDGCNSAGGSDGRGGEGSGAKVEQAGGGGDGSLSGSVPVIDAAAASNSPGKASTSQQGIEEQAEQAELEAIRAQFRKVDSHRLSLSR
ncbi:unnamed protein product [Ectocarpus sp. 12 AP-2014]